MISKDLFKFIDQVSKNLDKKFSEFSKKEKILSHSVKLTEEVWELSSEVLVSIWKARVEKLQNYSKSDLEAEFADVILTTLILAKDLDIDINKSLIDKINSINARGWL